MSTLAAHVAAIEDALASADEDKRLRVLRLLADQFTDAAVASALSPLAATVIDELLLHIAKAIEFRARVELSECLAHAEQGPVRTVRNLAYDPAEAVAGPVLRHSPLVAEEDLVAVARAGGQGHLLALAGRREVPESVTDVILDRGERPVLCEVAANEGARLSRAGKAALVRASIADKVLGDLLLRRDDVAGDLVSRLITEAREAVKDSLTRGLDPGTASAVHRAVEASAEALRREKRPVALKGDYAAAEARVRDLARQRRLTDQDIGAYLDEERWEDAVAAVAVLAGQPVRIAAQALSAAHVDPHLVILKAADVGWEVAEKVLRFRMNKTGQQRGLRDLRAAYARLSRASAERVLRYTSGQQQARPGA